MPIEIERKFLLANDGWKSSVIRRIRIRDGLIASNNGNKARVRIADSNATITLKSRRRGPIRTEFEYAIPYTDAVEILRTMCDGHVLDKVRHVITYAGAVWHVDVYEGILNGIVLAEVELQHPDRVIRGIERSTCKHNAPSICARARRIWPTSTPLRFALRAPFAEALDEQGGVATSHQEGGSPPSRRGSSKLGLEVTAKMASP